MDKIELNRWYYRDNDNETNPCTLFFLIEEDEEYFHGFTIEEDGGDDSGFEKPYFLTDFQKACLVEFINNEVRVYDEVSNIIFSWKID